MLGWKGDAKRHLGRALWGQHSGEEGVSFLALVPDSDVPNMETQGKGASGPQTTVSCQRLARALHPQSDCAEALSSNVPDPTPLTLCFL